MSQYTLQHKIVLLRCTIFYIYIVCSGTHLEAERVTVNDAIRLCHLLAHAGHALVVVRIAKRLNFSKNLKHRNLPFNLSNAFVDASQCLVNVNLGQLHL